MAARAYWSGQIRLALVSIPVEIYSAARASSGISFNQIHEPTGKRIKYEKVVPGVGPVEPDEIVKGYEIEKGQYVLVSDAEIDSVRLESKKTFELVQFVDAHEIDMIYFEKPYFVVPADDLAEEAFRVMRDALRATKKVGLGQLALRGRESICSIKPCGRGMIMETLRYADEVNKAGQFFRAIGEAPSPDELLELATTLIERRTAPWQPEKFVDHYETALRALIESKAQGKRVAVGKDQAAPKPTNVVDLMAALKASIEKAPAKPANDTGKTAVRPASKPRAVAGKEPAEAAPKAKPARKRA